MIIKIFGNQKEGKTTIAQLIKQTLEQYNIEVDLQDDNGEKPVNSLVERLNIIQASGGELKCQLKTIPYGRESQPQYAKNYLEKK